ncbi:hypothetical protein FIBSPDRAFT_869064 [Athelia psychrophila]|uniref:Uncharacterized protein n=1 Tax=Athelia psychrophila TaxID=1759441 RepID=A0A166CHP2_9AGAM|nr:hypothetical protein FIBSPDRAFT_869064 [Fibularhizoctonia sp. CBS 109695]
MSDERESAQYGEVEPDPELSDSGHRTDVDKSQENVSLNPLSPNTQMAADLERTGLRVICQDKDAKIAIVDFTAAVRISAWHLTGNVLHAGLASS